MGNGDDEIKLDASKIRFNPSSFEFEEADRCFTFKQLNHHDCKLTFKGASLEYSEVKKRLQKLVEGRGLYLDGKKLEKLEDICPDIVVPNSDQPSQEYVTARSSFMRCVSKIGNSVFTRPRPVPIVPMCLSLTLDETGRFGPREEVRMVGSNCFKVTVSLDGQPRMIEIHVPEYYRVEEALPAAFLQKGWQNNRKVYKLAYMNYDRLPEFTFLVSIEPYARAFEIMEISVFFGASEIPGFR